MAVKRIITNYDTKTPALDGTILSTSKDKAEMVERLKQILIETEQGKYYSTSNE